MWGALRAEGGVRRLGLQTQIWALSSQCTPFGCPHCGRGRLTCLATLAGPAPAHTATPQPPVPQTTLCSVSPPKCTKHSPVHSLMMMMIKILVCVDRQELSLSAHRVAGTALSGLHLLTHNNPNRWMLSLFLICR